MIENLPVSRAENSVKRMLLGKGGSAHVTIGKSMRILSCSSLDRPSTYCLGLSDFFSRAVSRYRLYDDDMVVEESRFERRQINSAISKLLEDVSADKEIIIMWEE